MTTSIMLLTKDEEKLLTNFQELKKEIVQRIGKEVLLAKLEDLVDSSICFEYKSRKNREYMKRDIPLFILKINRFSVRNYKEVGMQFSETVDQAFVKEIIFPFTRFIIKHIKNDSSIKIANMNEEMLACLFFLNATIFETFLDETHDLLYAEYSL